MTTTTKLPQETRRIRMDPSLAEVIEGLLKPYSGRALERAQLAVLAVRKAGVPGVFQDLLERYEAAILEAVDAD